MHTPLDLTRQLELEQRACARLALAVARDSHYTNDPGETMRAKGFGRFVKGGDALFSTDTGIELAPMNAAFVAVVDGIAVAGRIAGATRIPLASAARLQVGEVQATLTREGAEKLIAQLAFTLAGPPVKVQAQIVCSLETLLAVDLATQSGVMNILATATAKAYDSFVVSTLTAGTPASSPDLDVLFAGIGDARYPYLLLTLGDALSLPAGTLRDLEAAGVGVLTTPAASGVRIALDGAGLVLSDSGLILQTAHHADLPLSIDGGSPTTTLNLWQANLAALRAERFVRVAVRSNACAFASTGSPA